MPKPVRPSADIISLIQTFDQDIVVAEAEAEKAFGQVSEAAKIATIARGRLETLRSERATLAKIAEDRGIAHVPPPPESSLPPEDFLDDWRSMSRLDAVEQALKESEGSLHINDIESVLRFHGRSEDTYQLISASLANLKGRRGTVVPLGQGRWEYVRAGTNAAGFAPALGVADMDEIVRNSPSFRNVHTGDDAPGQ